VTATTEPYPRIAALRRSLPPLEQHRLANGLTVALLESRRSPVVASALVYGVGAGHEAEGEHGAAHFLEHMMFKGSAGYGAGQIDRLTRALGGDNNAFTSQDLTLYYFTFAADRWHHALAIEADRMAGLTLDPAEVESERRVILEELVMYEDEPWDALEKEVSAELFGDAPYGRPIIGTRESLAGLDGPALASFHRRYYRPGNAVLVLAGDLGEGALGAVEQAFGHLDGGGAPAAPPVASTSLTEGGPRRIERRHGEVPRMLFALPAPAADHPDHASLSLLAAVLGNGRTSRLHRRLVDEAELGLWVSVDLAETRLPGALVFALEGGPGVSTGAVEEELFVALEVLRREPPTEEEIRRARKMLWADWLFGHERVFQQAYLLGQALTLFDAEHPWSTLGRLMEVTPGELLEVARRYLRPEVGVLGWSLGEASGEGEAA
jgi:zinc protease